MSRQRDEYYTQKYNNYNYPRGRAWQSIPELPVRKSYEEKREEARQAIEPFLKPTKGRWPIYCGPREVDTSKCRVAVIRSWGTFDFRWDSYKQCLLEPQISKDHLLYCHVHDPDKKWPRITKTFIHRMNALKVEIPEKLISKKERNKIEYRKSSDSPNLFRKLVNRFR